MVHKEQCTKMGGIVGLLLNPTGTEYQGLLFPERGVQHI